MAAESKSSFEYNSRIPQKGKARKLVFLLHGYGKNAALMDKLADEVAKRLPDAKIIMPHAPDNLDQPENEDDHFLKVPDDVKEDNDKGISDIRRQWFSIAFKDQDAMRDEVLKIAKRLNKFIDQKRDDLGLNDGDIAIMGFSQGGGVALYSALLRKNPVGCLVAHSTIFMGEKGLKSKPPTLFLYGTADHEFTKDVASTQAIYQESARQLALYLDDLTVKTVKDLTHKTNAESRRTLADYIADRLRP